MCYITSITHIFASWAQATLHAALYPVCTAMRTLTIKTWPTRPFNGWKLGSLEINFTNHRVKEVWEEDPTPVAAGKMDEKVKKKKQKAPMKKKKQKAPMKAMKKEKAKPKNKKGKRGRPRGASP